MNEYKQAAAKIFSRTNRDAPRLLARRLNSAPQSGA